MNRNILYIILGLMIGAAIALVVSNNRKLRPREIDDRPSFHRRDKIPYGLHTAYNQITGLFPDASVSVNKKEPGLWDISTDSGGQAMVIITPEFNADEYEMRALIRFVQAGNDVFLSSTSLSPDAGRLLAVNINSISLFLVSRLDQDTLELSLDTGFFARPGKYRFPGKRYASSFAKYDEHSATVMGYASNGQPNFIHQRAGAGNFYVHLAPVAFTNYFMLHGANTGYYERVFSLMPQSTTRIFWDEYFRYKQREDNRPPKKNWFTVLTNMENSEGKKPFRAALLLALGLLLLYVLLEMRRRQRSIPIIKKPPNEMLEFTKTVGRLYHDKGDHNNLARKMSAYFLEYVRNRYKIKTSALNESFIKQVHLKTGAPEELVTTIVEYIHHHELNPVSGAQLAEFHKQLENFYKIA